MASGIGTVDVLKACDHAQTWASYVPMPKSTDILSRTVSELSQRIVQM